MAERLRDLSKVWHVAPSLPRDAWTILGGDALSAMGTGLTLPFLILYLHRVRGFGLGLAGVVVATVALVGLVGNPLSGVLSDRLGARQTVMTGLAVSAFGAIGLALVHNTWEAFASAAGVGLGASLVWPAQDALLASAVAAEQRSAVFAMRFATMNAGLAVGGLVAALLISFTSANTFVLIYFIDAATTIAYLVIMGSAPNLRRLTGGRVAALGSGQGRGGYAKILRDTIFLRVWALTALVVFVGYGQYHAAFPAFVTGVGGLSAGGTSVIFAANTGAVVLTQLVVLRVMAGRRRTRGVMLTCLFWGAAWAVTVLSSGLGAGTARVLGFSVAMVLFAIGETFLSPTLTAMVNDLAREGLSGHYNSASTLAWTMGFILGPAIGGFALGAGRGRELFMALIGLLAIAALAALRLERHLSPAANLVGSDRTRERVAPVRTDGELFGHMSTLR